MTQSPSKRNWKRFGIIILISFILGGGYVIYLWNMPHLDVQAQTADYSLTSSALVNEYLSNEAEANKKYFGEEGHSKILEVSGLVKSKTTDMNEQINVLLQDEGELAGVKCVFTASTNQNAEILIEGQTVSIKGIVRAGASYDEDLELYEPVLLEKCDVSKK